MEETSGGIEWPADDWLPAPREKPAGELSTYNRNLRSCFRHNPPLSSRALCTSTLLIFHFTTFLDFRDAFPVWYDASDTLPDARNGRLIVCFHYVQVTPLRVQVSSRPVVPSVILLVLVSLTRSAPTFTGA